MKKIILITGASSGIGKASAEQLIREGHVVYGLARDYEKLQEIKGLRPIKGDMTDDLSLERAVETIIQDEGKIDVLFNNAGYGLYGALEDVPVEEARHEFEVNLFGLARLTQLVLPHMRKAGSGLILNTSSMAGKVYVPLSGWYHASKHALEGLSDSLRLDVAQFGIKVSIIEPGAIATHFVDVAEGPFMKYSGKGAYGRMTAILAKSMVNLYSKPEAITSPAVVATTVSQAVNSKNPKIRYVVGKYAKPMIFMRKYLGDRAFDKIVMMQVRQAS
jgi:short-subunit dehydrogenase